MRNIKAIPVGEMTEEEFRAECARQRTERNAEIFAADLELGRSLGVPNPHAFASLASCCTEEGEALDVGEAVWRYEREKEKVRG